MANSSVNRTEGRESPANDRSVSYRQLSIVIPTYNRCELLEKCLESLEKQTASPSRFEVIVVDNGSDDGTNEMLLGVKKKNPDWIILRELRSGVSHARNTGWQHASTDWILFMDDDVLASQDLVENALRLGSDTDFDCIGGVFKGWFAYGRPKWIREDFFDKAYYPEERVVLQAPKITGCVMVMRKQVLIDCAGFDPDLDMIGDETRYGGETRVVKMAIQSGKKVAIDPGLFVYHVVSPYKMNLNWLLLSRFKMGQYSGAEKPMALGYFVIRLMDEMLRTTLRLPGRIWKWLTVKDYYWQNLIMESLLGIWNKFGKVQGCLSARVKGVWVGGNTFESRY